MSRSSKPDVRADWGDDVVNPKPNVSEGGKQAQRLYLKYCSIIMDGIAPGSDEAHAVRKQMMEDPEMIEHYVSFSEVTMQGPNWVDAFFRIVIKRLAAQEERRSEADYSSNDKYGAF